MIKWNRVTWYSKLLAAIFFFLAIPALGFYIGTQYAEFRENNAYFQMRTQVRENHFFINRLEK